MLRTDHLPPPTPDDDALDALEALASTLRHPRPTPTSPPPSPPSHSPQPSTTNLRDLTHMAVWTVSTAKPGNGIEQILDGSAHSYWQSDGPQPHTISAQFAAKVKVSEVQLYLNYAADESYTPAVVSVHAGSNVHDLRLVRKMRKLIAPQGWVRVPLGANPHICDAGSEEEESDKEEEGEGGGEEDEERMARRFVRAQRREKKVRVRQRELDERQKEAERGENGHLEAMRDASVTKAHMIQVIIHCNHQNGRDSHVRMVRALGPKLQIIGSSSKFTSKEFQMYETIR